MFLEYIQAFIVNLVAGACIALLTAVLIKRRKVYVIALMTLIFSLVPAMYAMVYVGPRVPRAQKTFSDFNRGMVANNYGFHWGIFTDGPFNGNSTIKISTERNIGDPANGYMKIDYSLGNTLEAEPYCGVVSSFSARPVVIRDVSRFSGIRFKGWHTDPIPEGVRVYISIGANSLIESYEGDFRYEFESQLRSDGVPANIVAEFDDFELSQKYPGDKASFTKNLRREIYQIAFVIVGVPGKEDAGVLMVDDIEFF
jgi:hypothetical protein